MELGYVHQQNSLFIISGFSGAGKSSVLRALEDVGFLCIDNLPFSLLASFFHLRIQPSSQKQKVALGIDIRAGTDMHVLVQELMKYRHELAQHIKIIFLTASDEILIKRFQETRRKHPLANDYSLSEALLKEKELLQPLKEQADVLINTNQFNIHELRNFVRLVLAVEDKPRLVISLISFGFKYGIPLESNFMFDMRPLPNPFFIPALKMLDGTHAELQNYLFELPQVQDYWHKILDFFMFSIEKSYQEGRFFMNVSFGCTGGRHRSVAFVHRLAQLKIDYAHFLVKHRDITKDN
ncbi:MAG: RNase adapter RapZ [Candidatus Babeliaceae bacterium]